MSILGKKIRMARIINEITGKTLIVPMDHGMTLGPISGVIDIKSSLGNIFEGEADAVVLHKGLIKNGYTSFRKHTGLIVHLSASTNLSTFQNFKVLVCSVEEAIRLGADAVSVHINLGGRFETKMLRDFGKIAEDADIWGIPLFAMVYIRGDNLKEKESLKKIKHAARIAAEIGADIVKVSYTGSSESFHEVILGCPIPIVIAGGNKVGSNRLILEMVKGAMEAGAIGVSMGRNLFQHTSPVKIIKGVSAIIHEGLSVEEVLLKYYTD